MANLQDDGDALIDYVNHRGERTFRRIRPLRWFYGATPWHPEPGWVCYAMDLEKRAFREFAMSGVKSWQNLRCGNLSQEPVVDTMPAGIGVINLSFKDKEQ